MASPFKKMPKNLKKENAMIDKNEIEALKELQELQKQEIVDGINAKLPKCLQDVSQGLNFKELKKFRDLKITNLREKEDEKGEKKTLDNEEVIYEVVVPLLEMRNVKDSELDNISVSDLLSFYRKVEALTNNPSIQEEIEKKN